MGINMRQWAGEKILKPEDVKNKPRREQIAVVRPPSESDKFPRPSLVCESGVIVRLSLTSVFNLCVEFGDDAGSWVGKFIECRYRSGLIDNKETEWLEIEALDATAPNQRRKIEPKSKPDFNDSIPDFP
jgi:hypothetical protein